MKKIKKIVAVLLVFSALFSVVGCSFAPSVPVSPDTDPDTAYDTYDPAPADTEAPSAEPTSEPSAEATPSTDTQTYYVTLVALVDPNFEMVCSSITVEIQEITNCVDFYYVTLESYNGWTNITNELPAGKYLITGVDMPRQLYSEYGYQYDAYFDVGETTNMTVSFTIGDPNAELTATPAPGVIIP